jgi:hypothetical protein
VSSDTPQPHQPVPRVDSFEMLDVDCTPLLTDEEKSWPVVALQPRVDGFEMAESVPEAVLVLRMSAHPESDFEALPFDAARLIRAVSDYEQSLGGAGLEFDQAASRESPGALVLHLVARKSDGAEERLRTVASGLNAARNRARTELVARQDADVLARIARTLEPVTDLGRIPGMNRLEAAEVPTRPITN